MITRYPQLNLNRLNFLEKNSWVSNEGSGDSPAPQLKTLLEEEIKFIESRSRSEIKMSDLDLKEI